MARIVKRGDSYLVTVSAGYDEYGKQKRISKTFHPVSKSEDKIKKELDRFVVDFEREIEQGNTFDKTKFANYYREDWLPNAELHAGEAKKLTVRALEDYKRLIENYAIQVIGNMKITEIKAKHLRHLCESMAKGDFKDKDGNPKALSIGTQRKALIAISSVFEQAIRDEIVEANPTMIARKELGTADDENQTKGFTLDETKRFLEYIGQPFESRHSVKDDAGNEVSSYTELHHTNPMWVAFFHLAIQGGFRRGEMLALTWNDIDFDTNTVHISKAVSKTKAKGMIEKAPKTKAGKRNVTMPESSMEILNKWKIEQMETALSMGSAWKGYRGKEFNKNRVLIQEDGSPMDVDTPYHTFKRIISRYNETHENKLPDVKLHGLRATSISNLQRMGVDLGTVAKRVGHSKPTTTLRYYTEGDSDIEKQSAELLEQIAK